MEKLSDMREMHDFKNFQRSDGNIFSKDASYNLKVFYG